MIFMTLCFLIFCYYAYYTYYVNLLVPNVPFLIKRDGSGGLMNIDFETYGTVAREIKLTTGLFYFVLFGIGYSFGTYAIYSKKQIGLVFIGYISILIMSGCILLVSSLMPNHPFVYRAGAEIKNFVWSPVFLFLILLIPRIIDKTNNQTSY